MSRYFLILDGVNVIGKSVYDGDTSKADLLMKKDAGEYAYREVDNEAFDSTPINQEQTKVDPEWQTAKSSGIQASLDFLASKLGLQ